MTALPHPKRISARKGNPGRCLLLCAASLTTLISAASLTGCSEAEIVDADKSGLQIQDLAINGELAAARSVRVAPPSISRMWNYNIKTLIPENSYVSVGDLVVAFDDKPIKDALQDKQAELKQAESELENSQLQETRTERDDALAIEEKRAEYEKNRRKSEILDQSMSRNERRKAQIDYQVASNDLELAQAMAKLHRNTGALTISLAERKVQRLKQEVSVLQDEVAKLKVTASIAGLVQYVPNWEGEKPSEGDSVRFGQPVLDISDLSQMQFRAQIDEADKTRFAVGAPVSLVLDGIAGSSLQGEVAELGNVVRDRARDDRRRVIDLRVTLSSAETELRPGMTAVINLPTADNVPPQGEIVEVSR
ncbi:HlyD family secretion protein [Microbulbifer pacificus]|uniref:Efflux RND transporter periplasmic adaptor subunit n=1 Tax=Microbulbifer pacificus TaxID=407164 RepID=A0AAU0MZC7_9GAMM|nr:efflux RND transporter periplasmic adaptor subunit [Microbulbifer pacificus]WOX05262.1 efflux RND transporter periplasmic adaptor subunit [Microbulbifer pacificus]